MVSNGNVGSGLAVMNWLTVDILVGITKDFRAWSDGDVGADVYFSVDSIDMTERSQVRVRAKRYLAVSIADMAAMTQSGSGCCIEIPRVCDVYRRIDLTVGS